MWRVNDESKLSLWLQTNLLPYDETLQYLGISKRQARRWRRWNVLITAAYKGNTNRFPYFYLEDIAYLKQLNNAARKRLVSRCKKIFLTKQSKKRGPGRPAGRSK